MVLPGARVPPLRRRAHRKAVWDDGWSPTTTASEHFEEPGSKKAMAPACARRAPRAPRRASNRFRSAVFQARSVRSKRAVADGLGSLPVEQAEALGSRLFLGGG